MRRGEIRYAEAGAELGRRPVLIVSATVSIPTLNFVTCAPLTTQLRDIPSRIQLGKPEGLKRKSEASCDALTTIAKSNFDAALIGELSPSRFVELDRAIARALDIQRAHLPLR
jgi:mRNA interferase MazF